MELPIKTKSRVDLIDITGSLKPSIEEGVMVVYTPHTTTGLFINENESNLVQDFKKVLEKLVPEKAGYGHDYQEGNTDSHIRGTLLGHSVVIPISGGNLELGTWQSVFFAELDGPRSRRVIIKEIKG